MVEHTELPLAISIMGPTASGKTALAIELCQHLPCDIVSVDSALIYRGMDIGTAKPTKQELELAPHRLIDIKDPADIYSVASFRNDALAAMQEISDAGRIPLLVGGTMMYFKSLVEGLSPLPQANELVRSDLMAQAEQLGWEAMHQQLQVIDPVSAQRIHPNDPQRLIRALEVFKISGKSLTELTQDAVSPIPYKMKEFALVPEDRVILHKRIEKRFKLMIEQGFQQEVENLRRRSDLHLDLPSIRCVGYRQMWQYLDGEFDQDEMIFRGIAATRQLAKRQLTWLRSWKNLTTLDGLVKDNLTKIIEISNTGR